MVRVHYRTDDANDDTTEQELRSDPLKVVVHDKTAMHHSEIVDSLTDRRIHDGMVVHDKIGDLDGNWSGMRPVDRQEPIDDNRPVLGKLNVVVVVVERKEVLDKMGQTDRHHQTVHTGIGDRRHHRRIRLNVCDHQIHKRS